MSKGAKIKRYKQIITKNPIPWYRVELSFKKYKQNKTNAETFIDSAFALHAISSVVFLYMYAYIFYKLN